MEKAETYGRAIRAGLAFTGWTQAELAQRLGIHEDTLGRKLKNPGSLTLAELIAADRAVKWTAFMGGGKA